MTNSCARLTLAVCFLLTASVPLSAQSPATPGITVGAGLRTSFTHDRVADDQSTNTFALDSVQLYLNGPVTKQIKFMATAEYDGINKEATVLDAAAQFEFSHRFNIWVGRFLPPSDRANLYGPYYSAHWSYLTDGVQDGYPTAAEGRDDGAMYWGQFGKVKLSAGAFDGASITEDDNLIGAARVQVDFWDVQEGHYLNGTFYGAKNLLAFGVAAQMQAQDRHASSVDFVIERKVGAGGAFLVETEFAKYQRLGGYDPNYATDSGGYVLASYLFPQAIGVGKVAVVGKFARARFSNGLTVADTAYTQTTSELNLNYIIKDFGARVMFFYKDTRYSAVHINSQQIGVGLQLQI